MVKNFSIQISTQGNADVHNITELVEKKVGESGIDKGIVTIFCPSSTSAVSTIEFESGCIADLQRLFNEILSPEKNYAHNSRWGDGNGHSHIRATLLGPSLTVPFEGRELLLGTWQQVIFIDFDNRPRQRKIILQLIGE
jgi:secondary thiamine-phosphate synthase enzyme